MMSLFFTTELVGAILLSRASSSDLSSFCSSPEDFLRSYDLDIGDLEISVVENARSSVHLCLPFYDGLEAISARVIAERELHDITGGEILITGGIIIGAIYGGLSIGGGLGIAVGVIGGGLIGTAFTGLIITTSIGIAGGALSSQGRRLDGSELPPDKRK